MSSVIERQLALAQVTIDRRQLSPQAVISDGFFVPLKVTLGGCLYIVQEDNDGREHTVTASREAAIALRDVLTELLDGARS